MFFSPRISLRNLARLSRRLSITLTAGIDVRKAWAREVERATGWAMHKRFQMIADAIQQGESVGEAIKETDDYFPPLFREIASVGEESGHLGEALAQLADHYDGQLRMRSTLLAAMVWPAIELSVALAAVALLIWLPSALTAHPIDILGFGLVGARGLQIYLCFLALVAAVVGAIAFAMHRGVFWVRPIQKGMLFIPAIGNVLRTLALARLAWSLHLTFNTGMNVRRAIRLSFNSTQNAYYTALIDPVQQSIEAGDSIYEAFLDTRAFPNDFLDTLHVGEQSGELVESMARLSRLYQAQAQSAMNVLAVIGGFLIWAMVAGMIVMLIFRLAFFYINTINNAANGKF